MRFYGPFERLFSSIETHFNSIGVGGDNLQVSAAITACQSLNVQTLYISKNTKTKSRYCVKIQIKTGKKSEMIIKRGDKPGCRKRPLQGRGGFLNLNLRAINKICKGLNFTTIRSKGYKYI